MPEPMNTYWITGLPGSGKTTCATAFWRARKDLRQEILIFNGLKLRVYLAENLALVGVYDDMDPLRNGTDRYGLTQRNVVKFIWNYLSQNTNVKNVVIEGLTIVNRPLLTTIKQHSKLHLIKLDVPVETCQARHAEREKQLAHRPGRLASSLFFTDSKILGTQRKISLQEEFADEVVSQANSDDALQYLLERCGDSKKETKDAIEDEQTGYDLRAKRQRLF